MARSDLMFVVFVLVAAVVLFAVVVVATGRGDVLDAGDISRTPADLPDHAIDAADLARLRFTVAARGYRMDQVDDVIDRLGRELEQRDRTIAELTSRTTAPATPAGRTPPAPLPRRHPGGDDAGFGR